MAHAPWHKQICRSLSLVQRSPARALASLRTLQARVQREAKEAVSDWHIEQTLEATSIVQHLGKHRDSAETILLVAEHHQRQLNYVKRAVVSARATAAMEFAAARDRRGAARELRRAVSRSTTSRSGEAP